MSSTDFPMIVNIRKIKREKRVYNGEKIYYISLTIEGVNYL
jgi:hypothetical protein